MSDWNTYIQSNAWRFVDELLEFVRIPSISALPEHAGDVQRAADWVAERLRAAGAEHVRVLRTGGHPVVYGDWLHAPGRPTVMVYGHFDTQPVDPLELWDSPPFEPVVRGDRIYGRGATDDKGNMLIPILAFEAMLKSGGKLPINVKFFFEGQEEIGSPQLLGFISTNRDLLSCDMVVSADGSQWAEDQPCLIVGIRGICGMQLDVVGPSSDLHSGQYGGTVHNPIHALVQILDSMRSPDGRVLVDGFYDEVRPLTDADRAQIAAVPFDEAEFCQRLGVSALFGEAGYTPLERLWARPTLEVNGIWGGFQGKGSKTVLPSEAHAKITCRLVPDQDPSRISRLVARHVAKHTPPGVKATVTLLENGAPAYLIPAHHPGNKAVHAVLRELYGKEPYYIRMGGSVPVCALFLSELKAYTVTLAFGLPDEMVHAPNEFFRISSFQKGQSAYCMLLERLGGGL